MEKIIIEDVKVGVSEGGIACGPVCGHTVVEARICKADDKVSYYGLVEVAGTLNFYESEESRYEKEISEDYADDEVFPESEGYGDYYEFYEKMLDLSEEDKAHALLLKYLVCLARLDWNEVDQLKADSIGKAIGSFEIPVCDVEEEYVEDNEVDDE